MTHLAFLGGTGPEGRGLATRFADSGYTVVIGSRNLEKSRIVASKISTKTNSEVVGATNLDAANKGDIIFITVPYEAQKNLLNTVEISLKDKIVVSTVSPIRMRKDAELIKVREGSAAEQAQRLLPHSKIVAAFHHVSATHLLKRMHILSGDVIVSSNYPSAKDTIIQLAKNIPTLRAIDGGMLQNARYLESLTPLLINLNRSYKVNPSFNFHFSMNDV